LGGHRSNKSVHYPYLGFDLLYAFVIVRLDRRNLVWINVTTNPAAEWLARQLTEAFPGDGAPRYLIRDRDRIYGAIVPRRMRAMGIRDKPTAPASPWQNGFAERLIPFYRLGRGASAKHPASLCWYNNRSLDKDAPGLAPGSANWNH
jgi:hypothetical protein